MFQKTNFNSELREVPTNKLITNCEHIYFKNPT